MTHKSKTHAHPLTRMRARRLVSARQAERCFVESTVSVQVSEAMQHRHAELIEAVRRAKSASFLQNYSVTA